MRHPDVNVQFADEALLRFPSANIGIAVAAPQGLVVPVIRSVERLSLAEVAAGARGDRRQGARRQRCRLADLEGGTFTISNLGMFGVEQFIAVLNPPQAAILAVGATVDRPVVVDGEVVVRPMMTVTLTVDHRAVDGAPGRRLPADREDLPRGSRARAVTGVVDPARGQARRPVPALAARRSPTTGTSAAFDTDVSISHYVDGWGRKGDAALVAMEGGHPVGAAWYRLFPSLTPATGSSTSRRRS